MTPVLICVPLALAAGLLAGEVWRRSLRQERDSALAMVDRWNQADNNYALDEVGSITPERRTQPQTVVGDDLDVEPWVSTPTYGRRLT